MLREVHRFAGCLALVACSGLKSSAPLPVQSLAGAGAGAGAAGTAAVQPTQPAPSGRPAPVNTAGAAAGSGVTSPPLPAAGSTAGRSARAGSAGADRAEDAGVSPDAGTPPLDA